MCMNNLHELIVNLDLRNQTQKRNATTHGVK